MMCFVSGGKLKENMSNFIETFSVTCVDDEMASKIIFLFKVYTYYTFRWLD